MRLILDIINLKWSDVIGQIHLSMWQYMLCSIYKIASIGLFVLFDKIK